MEWDYLSIPKPQRWSRWSLGISNFIPHFTGFVITYPCWDQSYSMFVRGATGLSFGIDLRIFFLGSHSSTLYPWKSYRALSKMQTTFWNSFRNKNQTKPFCIIIELSLNLFTSINWQCASTSLGNGLASVPCQSITWTNDDIFNRRVWATRHQWVKSGISCE